MERIITGVSISHRDASVDRLAAASHPSQADAVSDLLAHTPVTEAFVLQTCNRVEAYVVTDDEAAGREALAAFTGDVADDVVTDLGHEASLRHLLRVACGLESLVVGEDQILGQVRDAYEDARAAGGIGPLLEEAVTKAIHVGERARTETAINDGAVSLASAAVSLAEDETALSSATALVVGAGDMATLAAERLAPHVERLAVANRTVETAEHVVAGLDCPARGTGLDALPEAVSRVDLVVSATGAPETVFDPDAFVGAGETLVVDIAQPRDVPTAAAAADGVTLRDIDDLESVTDETYERRSAAAVAVESIVDRELEHLLKRYKRKRADSAISAMYEGAERIKARELETALGKLDLAEEDEQVVADLADAIVSKLLAAPTNSLRDAAEDDDWTTIHTALQLFDPSGMAEESTSPGGLPTDADAAPEGIPDDASATVRDQVED